MYHPHFGSASSDVDKTWPDLAKRGRPDFWIASIISNKRIACPKACLKQERGVLFGILPYRQWQGENSQKRRSGHGGEFVEVEPQTQVLKRCKINLLRNFKERDYIAVSWVWEPSPDEDITAGSYLIESRDGREKLPSDVRDTVLKWVMKYSSYLGTKPFWIDKICINQHNKEEKEVAIQTMDLVYSLNQNSLAIINRHITTEN